MPTKSEAKERIVRALKPIPELVGMNSDAPDFQKWRRSTEIMISNTFPSGSRHAGEFGEIRYRPNFVSFDPRQHAANAARVYREGLVRAKTLLESFLDEIEEYGVDDQPARLSAQESVVHEHLASNRVFVVHGRDDGTRNTVARFLESLGLEVTILQEQTSEGRTIIEKFEDHSGVGFAVVLCTPDDVGKLATAPDNWRPRPRQNVILELGFFLGRLGRNKVCALLDGDMEMPSDYDGVLYIPMDASEGWKLALAREMKAAGMTIDLNQAV